MNLGFPVFLYYVGLFFLVLILTKFIFTRYLQFARNFNLVNTPNQRSVHHGKVFTGGGMVVATVLLVAVVVLDVWNLLNSQIFSFDWNFNFNCCSRDFMMILMKLILFKSI